MVFRSFSISFIFGIDGWAPNFVTDSAAAAFANLTASLKLFSSDSATVKAPLNTSPAPVVSTALTSNPETIYCSPLLSTKAPFEPSVIITDSTPFFFRTSEAKAALALSTTFTPVNNSASVSFGVITDRCESKLLGSGCAGAGFKITFKLFCFAIITASVIVSIGVSSCVNKISAA